jgi:lipopolysaccharide transport system ATP-binding protein
MSSITRLCPRVIMLDQGKILMDGPANEAVAAYSEHWLDTGAVREWPDPAKAPGGEIVRLRSVRIHTRDGRTADSIDIRQPFGLEMEYDVLRPGFLLLPYFNLHNQESVFELEAVDVDQAWRGRARPRGRYTSTAWVPGNLLADGVHFVSAGLTAMDPDITEFHERDAVAFHLIDSLSGDSARGDWMGPLGGAAVRPLLDWSTRVTPFEESVAVTHE